MLAACARAPQPPQLRCAAPRAAAPLAAPPAASLRPRAAPGATALHAVRAALLPQLLRAPPRRRHAMPGSRRFAAAPRAAIKPITTFDPDNFTLEPEADAELRKLLGSATFCSQVAAERGWQPQAADAPAVRGGPRPSALRRARCATGPHAAPKRVTSRLSAASSALHLKRVFCFLLRRRWLSRAASSRPRRGRPPPRWACPWCAVWSGRRGCCDTPQRTTAPLTPLRRVEQDLEPLAKDTERYVFINVPYNFMFSCKARPFSRKRLVAP